MTTQTHPLMIATHLIMAPVKKVLGALGLVAALAACDQPTGPANRELALSAEPIPSSPSAGPGSVRLSAAQAAQAFSRVCVASLPDFATAPQRLGEGFVQNSTTGTYYNSRLNLSFKLIDGDCSMVFGSSANSASVLNQLSATHPDTRARTGVFANLYNARISAR